MSSEIWFPFNKIRPAQERSLEAIERAWSSGKSTVILDLPTGVGKSPIAVAASKLSASTPFPDGSHHDESTWALTTQKILQRQYVADFDEYVENISAKTNYPCELYNGADSCDRGMRFKKHYGGSWEEVLDKIPNNEAGKDTRKLVTSCRSRGFDHVPCGSYGTCPYKTAFVNWMSAEISLTNLAYFMNIARTRKDPNDFKRGLLVIDEAHLLDDEIVRFHEIDMPRQFIQEELKLPLPDFLSIKQMQDWTVDQMIPAVSKRRKMVEERLSMEADCGKETSGLSYKVARLEQYHKRAISFGLADLSDWVICTSEDGTQTAKPIHSGLIGPSSILQYGTRRLLMSGTILDKNEYCKHVGLNPKDVAYYAEPSPFDEENRLVVMCGIGSMGRKSQGSTTPKILSFIREILEEHKHEKGIIHTGSYRLNSLIIKELNNPRLLSHAESKGRDKILKYHFESDEPTVLVSPSMSTGVDLRGAWAKWGVLCKVPFPYLGDARIRALFESDKSWYYWKTAQEIMQACGRIVRSEDDEGIMYILDSDLDLFMRQGGSFLPQWWKDSLRKFSP